MLVSPKGRLELRMKQQSRELSPDRAKPSWIEPKSKLMPRRVQVLYYLSRNGQLEHPHFMEVTLSSNEGLYLSDVKQRLNALRGKGMANAFSWSSKRSYKNGYVWHDLSEDDIIHPTHGNDFVLKGSELFEGSSERCKQSITGKLMNSKHSSEGPLPVRFQDAVSSTNKSLVVHKQRVNGVEERKVERTNSREHICDGQGPPLKFQGAQKITTNIRRSLTGDHPNPSGPGTVTQKIGTNIRHDISEELHNPSGPGTGACPLAYERCRGATHKSYGGESSWSPLELGEYKVYKAESIASTVDQGADAATQTEERRVRCTKGVSTEEEEEEECNSILTQSKENQREEQIPTELSGGEVSPPSSSGTSPESPDSKMKSNGKASTLTCQSVEEETYFMPAKTRASTVLIQLISCGSIAVKDHSFVTASHSKSQVSCDGSRSQSSVVLSRPAGDKGVTVEDELEYMPDNPRFAQVLLEDKEYFSGSIVEIKTEKEAEGGDPTLKRCASYSADRSSKSDFRERSNEEESGGTRAKCIPRKIKPLKKQQPKNNAKKPPSKGVKETSKLRRLYNGISASTETSDHGISANKGSKTLSDRGSQRSDSFREEPKIIKGDERQPSLDTVAVESQVTRQDVEEGTQLKTDLRQHLQEYRTSEITTKTEQGSKCSRVSQSSNHHDIS